ncbi:hypothetical protein EDD85DRAFT_970123 [Armillaria nabsnona]|nr:hypothetical protein EDD85DRAFT_970123 [Armillaria nabsnona]
MSRGPLFIDSPTIHNGHQIHVKLAISPEPNALHCLRPNHIGRQRTIEQIAQVQGREINDSLVPMLNTFLPILEAKCQSIEKTTRESHQYGPPNMCPDTPIHSSIHFCSHLVLHGCPPPPSFIIYHNPGPSPPAYSSLLSLPTTSSTRVSNSLAQLRTCTMQCNELSGLKDKPAPIEMTACQLLEQQLTNSAMTLFQDETKFSFATMEHIQGRETSNILVPNSAGFYACWQSPPLAWLLLCQLRLHDRRPQVPQDPQHPSTTQDVQDAMQWVIDNLPIPNTDIYTQRPYTIEQSSGPSEFHWIRLGYQLK